MRRSELAEIRSTLAAVWAPGSADFASFEVEGRRDGEERWVQFLDGQLNVRWPRPDDPRTGLAALGVRLPTGVRVAFHHPGQNCVLLCGDADVDTLASLVLELLERVEGLGPGSSLRCDVVRG